MDPPRTHIFHYHRFNTSSNLLHPQLHNSNQISQLDFKQINWDDSKGSPVAHDVHLGCVSDMVKPGSQSLQQHVVTRKSSPYDGSSQDSHLRSTK